MMGQTIQWASLETLDMIMNKQRQIAKFGETVDHLRGMTWIAAMKVYRSSSFSSLRDTNTAHFLQKRCDPFVDSDVPRYIG